MKSNLMKPLLLIVFILGTVIVSLAQPLPTELGPDGVLPGGGAPTLSCPVGNGYWILLGLAICFGIYKTWQMHKAERTA